MPDSVRVDSMVDAKPDGFDHRSDPSFLEYYSSESLSPATVARFRTIRDKSLKLLNSRGLPTSNLRVADIGCGAGTQARLWAELNHSVCGIDVNEPLIQVARQRAAEQKLDIRFDVGTATALPYKDKSFDVCLLPELLEHVPDWQLCLREAVRILSPVGLLYLSTTNRLCPRQQEFNLPMYSWYPGFMKRRYEKLAVTTRPELANYATYPAVNWFTFAQLRAHLRPYGFECLDRFHMLDDAQLSGATHAVMRVVRAVAPLRFLGLVLTEGTTVFALRRG